MIPRDRTPRNAVDVLDFERQVRVQDDPHSRMRLRALECQGGQLMPGKVHVIDHPLVQHKLTLMRMKGTGTSAFRTLLGEIGMLMAYEVARDLPTRSMVIETPLAQTTARVLDGKKLVLISIMRAGAGILDGMLR